MTADPLAPAELTEARRIIAAPADERTHWETCWRAHPWCLATRLLATIEAQSDLLAEVHGTLQREARDRTENLQQLAALEAEVRTLCAGYAPSDVEAEWPIIAGLLLRADQAAEESGG